MAGTRLPRGAVACMVWLAICPTHASACCEAIATVVDAAARPDPHGAVILGTVVVARKEKLLASVDVRVSKVLAGTVRARHVRIWSLPVSAYPQLSRSEVVPGTTWAFIIEPSYRGNVPEGDFILQGCSEGYARVAKKRGEAGVRLADLERDIRSARARYSEFESP